MRIIGLCIFLLLSFISNGQSKFEPLRKKLTENKTYEYVYNFENNYAEFRTFNNKMGLIDTLGNVIIKPNYEYIKNHKDLKNIFEAGIISNKKYKRGFIDLQGKVIIPFEYDDVFYFGNNLIRVSKNEKTGVVDMENKIILPLKYDYIQKQNGILFVQTNNKIDLFDSKGKQLTNFQAADIDYFKDKRSVVTLQNKNTLIIDDRGSIILNPITNHQFEKVFEPNSYLIKNTTTKKKGVINSFGKYEVECKYDEILPSNSIYIVRNNEKDGLINKKDSILKPLLYDHIYMVSYTDSIQFQNQYFAQKGNLQGVINPFLEKEIIPIAYKSVKDFSDFYITTNLSNKNGIFSTKGEVIIPENYEFCNGYQNKIFAVKENKNYILSIDGTNYNEVEVPVTEFVRNKYFSLGMSKSKYQIFKNENKFGVVSIENKIMIPSEFDSITQIYSTGEFIVQKNKKYGIINAENQVVFDLKYDTFNIIKEVVKFEIKNPKTTKFYSVNFSKELK
ncbi:WG repeat-containing protein [Flavobacterium sp. UBA7680]|uniref:WG repeat-containing protein n=1 Tax=Flavobacterium sp. UBA7680 TaxID=1946559 RepID=UPI0025BC18AD|nr:WG repeat-containing protein [Flavobacterium sp. UBA7680]